MVVPLEQAASPAIDDVLEADVLDGLRRPEKELPSKYFYDQRGSELFERITELPEYYLTRAELEVLERHAGDLAGELGPGCLVIEPGSGSGRKTRLLLQALTDPVGYVPIEVSPAALAATVASIHGGLPWLEVLPLAADYTQSFAVPAPRRQAARRVIFFPGSTLGNFRPHEAVRFLARMAEIAGPGGRIVLGLDHKKDKAVLERAYNDGEGVTAAFNLNLLTRLNRELGTDFRPDRFAHRALYDERHGRIEMRLYSLTAQTVRLGAELIPFAAGESILTEVSCKYSPGEVDRMAAAAGLAVAEAWTDGACRFGVYLLAPAGAEPSPPR